MRRLGGRLQWVWFFLGIVSPICGQEFLQEKRFLIDPLCSIEFRDGVAKYVDKSYREGQLSGAGIEPFEGPYGVVTDSGYEILTVITPQRKREFIMFYNAETLMLYDRETRVGVIGTDLAFLKAGQETYYRSFQEIESTGYLTETLRGKTATYPPTNLADYELTTAWAVPGGVGEQLSFSFFEPANNIVFANGYFDPQKLYLYEFNNRIRRLWLRGYDEQGRLVFEQDVELKDTPNLQLVRVSVASKRFEARITEVYPGTRYTDTCLAGIFCNLRVLWEQKYEKR